jgi:CIC family chloride channel protein
MRKPEGSGPRRSERVRQPAPLIRSRIPSGRGATEQPNATHDHVPMTKGFWLMLVLTGILTGLFGVVMMLILFTVEHLSYGFHHGSFQAAVIRDPAWRRVVPLAVAGLVGGPAWYLLRKYTKGQRSEIDEAIWSGDGELSLRRSFVSSAISEVVIGAGASIGREAAPKLLGGVAGSLFGRLGKLTPAQRTLLIACGGGAGLAAVYNVPIGGAVFTAEILLGSLALPVVIPALICAGIATVTAWIYLPVHATYIDVPNFHLTVPLAVFSVLVGPLIGIFSVLYIRLVAWVSHHRAKGRRAIFTPLVAFTVLGFIGIVYPELFGNGKDMAHEAFLDGGTIALLLALAALKPIVTSMCLSSGASGGLFTPVLSTGAVLGAGLGLAWSHLWAGSPSGAYALVGAAAMIGAGMQAPLAGIVLVLELVGGGFPIAIPIVIATATATFVARQLDGYSMYTARLAAIEGELADVRPGDSVSSARDRRDGEDPETTPARDRVGTI